MISIKAFIRQIAIFCAIFVITAAVYGQSPRTSPQTITSGRVNTLGKFSFQYGRLDISVKLPHTANGLWPAVRLVGADYGKTPWPDCGEIGLFEMGHFSGITSGTQDRLISAAAHWGSLQQDKGHPSHTIFKTNMYRLQYGDFHLITMIWNQKWIRMYLDLDKLPAEYRGQVKPYFEMEITPELEKYFCQPFSIVINLAAGGEYTGIIGRDKISEINALNEKNNFQAAMYVDFVRVLNEEGNLIFYDDFHGSRIDSTKWNVEANENEGANHELQSYRRPNVTIGKDRASEKTCLILTVKRE
ncbi:MAG: glycoside hydrolase family 16 protein [Treponema sp.]|nr:glycoside hydrolase family 16 protein [Treponema sp.]